MLNGTWYNENQLQRAPLAKYPSFVLSCCRRRKKKGKNCKKRRHEKLQKRSGKSMSDARKNSPRQRSRRARIWVRVRVNVFMCATTVNTTRRSSAIADTLFRVHELNHSYAHDLVCTDWPVDRTRGAQSKSSKKST